MVMMEVFGYNGDRDDDMRTTVMITYDGGGINGKLRMINLPSPSPTPTPTPPFFKNR